MMVSKTLLDYIQLHERAWGTDSYPGKPSLEEMLNAPVIVFWAALSESRNLKTNPRYKATIYEDLSQVENRILKMVFRSQVEAPKERIAKIFRGGNPVKIKSVNVVFDTE